MLCQESSFCFSNGVEPTSRSINYAYTSHI